MNEYLEQQKANIDSAISAIESGAQEYRIGTRMVRRADLATLYAERVRLEEKLESQNQNKFVAARLMRR